MKPVFVLLSGCVHEGGSVHGAFLNKDLADAKFEELVNRKRESNISMEEYAQEQREKDDAYWNEVGYWIQEKLTVTPEYKEIIFHEMDYIRLRKYDCEE